MRFTSKVVTDAIIALKNVAPDKDTERFITDCVTIHSTFDKRGTAYSGMGGRMSTQYGGLGARRALAYVYGIGVQLDLWSRVYENDRDACDKVTEALARVQIDRGVSEQYSWSQLGREYTKRVNL